MALGILFGPALRDSPARGHTFEYRGEILANWDGQWYKAIAARGYSYDPKAHSSVAFFPAYPLTGRIVARLTGLSTEVALVIISNLSLIITFVIVMHYINNKNLAADEDRLGHFVLLAMSLAPISFFFRMAYSESMFLALTALTLYGIAREWPLIATAAIVGLATATRPVGVGLIPALLLHAWRRPPGMKTFPIRFLYLLPICLSGILTYIIYQYLEFGDPLAFAHTQENWGLRPPSSLGARLFCLATLEPIRSVYDPASRGYWGVEQGHPLLTLRVADPAYFLAAAALVALGAFKRWLNEYELAVAIPLLLIPYATVGYEQYMRSAGRFASAVVPVYFVLGHLLLRVPGPVLAGLAAISGFLLGIYSSMFSCWYLYI